MLMKVELADPKKKTKKVLIFYFVWGWGVEAIAK